MLYLALKYDSLKEVPSAASVKDGTRPVISSLTRRLESPLSSTVKEASTESTIGFVNMAPSFFAAPQPESAVHAIIKTIGKVKYAKFRFPIIKTTIHVGLPAGKAPPE